MVVDRRVASRGEICCRAVERARTQPEVAALLLVGSGAHGFADRWSDVDLVAVVTGAAPNPDVVAADFLKDLEVVASTRWHHRAGVDVFCATLPDGVCRALRCMVEA